MSDEAQDLVLVGRDVEITSHGPAVDDAKTIALLRKENAKLLQDLESNRSLFRELADTLIEHRLRPTNNPLNYLAMSKVLAAYKKQNPFWRSRAQEMHEVNYPQQVSIESDIGVKILAEGSADKPRLK